MKQFAIIGLGAFGLRMLEELLVITNEIIIIDKDKDIIDKYKDLAKAAYITDAINEAALVKIIPPEIDAVIVDLGGKIEVSIMTTNYLKKMGIKDIIVKAQTDEHGEVLAMVGATRVIFPDQEAAKRIAPMLASSNCIGKTLLDANLRKLFHLNVVAMRKLDMEEFFFINDPSYVFVDEDVLLVAGDENSINKFSRNPEKAKKQNLGTMFRNLFPKKN